MKTIEEIVAEVVANFRCFGGGRGAKKGWGNPIAEFLKEKPPSFAGDVDVEEVVRFVLKAAGHEKTLKHSEAIDCLREVMTTLTQRRYLLEKLYGPELLARCEALVGPMQEPDTDRYKIRDA